MALEQFKFNHDYTGIVSVRPATKNGPDPWNRWPIYETN